MNKRDRTKERACEKAILRTLAYRAVFSYPLSFHQLSTSLINKKSFDYEFFKKELRRLIKNKSVEIKKERVSLPGVKVVNWESRYKKAQEILMECTPTIELIKNIPWIKMLCVTGSVAAYNSDKDADLDVFIVTSHNRLWLTRMFLVILLKICRRYPRQKGNLTKICPNILMDDTKLSWSKKRQSVYTAHEVLLMQPLINKDDTYFKFIKANDWIFKYFCNFYVDTDIKLAATKNNSWALRLLESLSMKMQLQYMKKHKTNEVTRKNFIHFNTNDNYERINDSYEIVVKSHKLHI